MKYGLNLFAILLTISIGTNAQVHVDRRNSLPIRRCDAWELAMYQQLGVIGNDWYGTEYLGTAPAETLQHINAWWPITYNGKAFKRTVKGQLLSFFRRTAGFGQDDDDYNFSVMPIKDNLFEEAKERLKPDENNVKGEIDLPSNFWSKYNEYSTNVPKQELDQICLYGPWVHDAITIFKDHNYLEIHPIQQLWWTTIYNGLHTYHLNLFQDASNRFDTRGQYEEVQDLKFKEVWAPNPVKGVFSIAFEAPLNTKTREFEIKVLESRNVVQSMDHNRIHYLIYKNDTLVKMTEPRGTDYFKVKFDSLAIDAYSLIPNFNTGKTDSIIKGFIVIETSIEKNYSGNFSNLGNPTALLIFNVEEKSKLKKTPTTSLPQFKVDVVLDSIKCFRVDDHDDAEDLFGYLGVKIINENELPIGVSILGNIESNLLWSRLDGDDYTLHLRKNQVAKINKKLTYTLSKTDSLIIVGDLDEDDDNDDNNPNDMDMGNWVEDDDDKLGDTQFCKLSNFSDNLNRNFIQFFKSGGTDVRAFYTVIATKIRPTNVNLTRFH